MPSLDKKMLQSPDDWREEVAPFVREAGKTRDTNIRKAVKTRIHKQIAFDRAEELNDSVLLTKKRYTAYTRFWEDATASDASSDFEQLHGLQNGRYDSSSERLVAVRDNARIRMAHGHTVQIADVEPSYYTGQGDIEPNDLRRDRDRRRDHSVSSSTIAPTASRRRPSPSAALSDADWNTLGRRQRRTLDDGGPQPARHEDGRLRRRRRRRRRHRDATTERLPRAENTRHDDD